MLAKWVCIALLAVPVLAQKPAGILERIRSAPLAPDARQAVTTSFEQKKFDRLETLMAGATNAAVPQDRAALHAILGALEFLGGRMSLAVQAFRQADGVSPLDDHDRFTLAMALVDLGDVQASRTELTRLTERHPDQPIYLYWLARLDYGQRLYDDAVQKFKKVIDMDPSWARGYDNLGLTYDMMGLNEEAHEAFAKAVVLNRNLPAPSPWPPHNLGYLRLRLQQFDQAEKDLREALRYDPQFALAHYHLARVLEREDRNDAAVDEYKAAAALDVKLAEPLYSLGLLYHRRGRESESAAAFEEYRRRKALIANE